MRSVKSLSDVQIVLREILDWKDTQLSKAKDQRGLQIKNAGDATAPTDLVTLRQLEDKLKSAKSTVVQTVQQTVSDSPGTGSGGGTTIINNYPVVKGNHGFGATFSGGGNPIPAGLVVYLMVPNGGTINAWDITIDNGTCTFQIWKTVNGTTLPSGGNAITSSGISITTGNAIHSIDVSDFTERKVLDRDIIGIYLSAVAGGAAQIFMSVELT